MSNPFASIPTRSGGPVLSLSELRAFDPRAKERGGESDFCCPLCGSGKPVDQAHRSLGVNLTNGAWYCHRCDQSGKLSDFWTEKLADRPQGRRAPVRKPLALPPLARRDDAPPPDLPAPIEDRFSPLARRAKPTSPGVACRLRCVRRRACATRVTGGGGPPCCSPSWTPPGMRSPRRAGI